MNPFMRRFEEYAISNPEQIMLQIGEEKLTYSGFIKQVTDVAKSLSALGISENHKVGIIMPNSIGWYSIFWGAIYIGAQPVPIDPQSGVCELKELLTKADIEVCVISQKYRGNHIMEHMLLIKGECSKLKQVVVYDEVEVVLADGYVSFNTFITFGRGKKDWKPYDQPKDHAMSLACTSGTTGNAKILVVPAEGFYKALIDMGDYLGFTSQDKMLIGMPLYHQGGFGMGLQVGLKGGRMIYEPQFDPYKFIEIIREQQVTIIQLTVTLAKLLIATKAFTAEDLKTVKCCYFAGEVLPLELANIFIDELNIRVINVIGSSETATMTIWDSDKDRGSDPSDFSVLPFTKAKVLDEKQQEVGIGEIGQLFIYTTAVIYSYYKNLEASEEQIKIIDGERWFNTGDLVKKLEDNRIRFVGRKKRIIKRGANLVYAEEIEAFLLGHHKIVAVGIQAKADELIGERIVAYVQLVKGETLTRGELLKFYKGKMSSYKVPDELIIMEEIPHDIGKVQYKYMRRGIGNQ